jgi:hypothetical protein
MNQIAAFGNDENVCEFAENIVEFCVRKLMPRMRTLDICINIEEDCDVYGYCLAVDKREFALEIKQDLSAIDFITTICHEMTHVAQYAQGRLPINGKMEYKTQEEYENVWYEKEAYEMEKQLTAEYLKEFFGK